MRIAAIDIGTNSIHMVIASATGHTGFEVVDREREVVQVGRGSFGTKRLRPDAIRRTVGALARYVQLARRHQVDRIMCTATAAVREASNGGEFLQQAREASGITPRVIPADEEGRLIYLAVKSALQLDHRPSLMVDIGGGSMQLVVGDRERMVRTVSAPLGALRLTELMLDEDPPQRRDLQRMRRHIRKVAEHPLATVRSLSPVRVYGSSGSIHALAQAAHARETGEPIGQINGHVLTVDSLETLTRSLQRMDLAERERIPGIDARRAEIIVPGAMTLLHVLDAVGADSITISDFGVREGLVMDYITSHQREISDLENVPDLRLRSVLRLLAKFHLTDDKHPHHVARLALMLFDALRREHGLDDAARELLQYAALLHDIGSAIAYDRHSRHSAYIVRNGNLRGYSGEEIDMIALLARYHAKGRPRNRDGAYAALRKPQRRAVRWLSALLQVVEGLDRSHYQLIDSARVVRGRRRLSLLLSARRDARLEFWAARRRTSQLERLLGMPIVVKLDPASERRAAARAEAKKPKAAAGRVAATRSGVVIPIRRTAK